MLMLVYHLGSVKLQSSFNVLADLLSWKLKRNLHYLDDFLTLGPPGSLTCTHNVFIIRVVCMELGVPLTMKKVEGPSDCLTFLGITFDTNKIEVECQLRSHSEYATYY